MGVRLRIVRSDRRPANRQSPAGLAGWLLARSRRFFRSGTGCSRSAPRMELVETLQLGGKRQLMLVACEGRRYLVGAGGESVHSIAEMKQPAGQSLEEIACAR